MLDPRRLKAFLTLAEELHFGRAALKLNIAQSAFSQQIKALEAQLGVTLFHRAKRAAVHLTDAGELFRAEAAAAVAQLERAEAAGRLAARGQAGSIALGYVASAALCGLLAAALGRFRQGQPAVAVTVAAMETPRQLAAIADGSLDVGLIRPRRSYPEGIRARLVHSEPLEIAMAVSHPLASDRPISARQLNGQLFVAPQFDEDDGFVSVLQRLGTAGGIELGPVSRVSDFITALSLVAAGYGLVLAPRSAAKIAPDGVIFRRLEDFDEQIGLSLIHRATAVSPCVRRFIDSID